ncbi:MAG: hypothetical protein SOW18_03920 [Peptoniphilus sp.]|nr:hypothetical protein [Peptoniphilus sp.]MDY3118667.1 hypothetical protein [Peptoniphilus sp.]
MSKWKKRIVLFLIIIIAAFAGIKGKSLLSYRAETLFRTKTEQEITDLSILKGGVLATFDGDHLFFYNKNKGKVAVDRLGEGQKAFFGESDAMLYDADVDKVTVFGEDGKEKAVYHLEGSLFNAQVQEGTRIFHCRYDDGEKLFVASDGGSLSEVFQTKNYILDYRFDSPKSFVVTELSNAANGYKTTVYVEKGKADRGAMETTEFPIEVAMHTVVGKYPIISTEKHLYGLDKELITESTPILSDIALVNNRLYSLHSGLLSVYDGHLKEKRHYVMEANVDRLAVVGESLFAYGSREVLSQPTSKQPFHMRFDDNQEKLLLKDGYMAAYEHKHLAFYKLKAHLFPGKNRVQELKHVE